MSGVNNINITNQLEAGLRAEGLREKATASNVANLQTPGYRALDVRFEELLAKALTSGEGADIDDLEGEVFVANATPVKPNGNDVSLEAEVGKMVKNTLRHTAYVRLLGKKYRQIELAMDVK
jgi:flagellar basal-body rod protein FlgB